MLYLVCVVALRIQKIFFQIVRPRNMIFTSLITCVASAILLVVAGGDSKFGLYTGAGIVLLVCDTFLRSS